jgi:hypothetical protein
MVRKQIVIDPETERALAERARELGVSQSALIRQAIDRLLEDSEEVCRDKAWDEALAFMKGETRARAGSGGRKWTREEIHER